MGVDRLADQSVCGLFSGWQRPSGSTATCGCIHALDAGPSPEPCHRRSATPRPSHRATVGLAARLSCTRARTSQSWCANRPAPVDQPERADRCVLGAYRPGRVPGPLQCRRAFRRRLQPRRLLQDSPRLQCSPAGGLPRRNHFRNSVRDRSAHLHCPGHVSECVLVVVARHEQPNNGASIILRARANTCIASAGHDGLKLGSRRRSKGIL